MKPKRKRRTFCEARQQAWKRYAKTHKSAGLPVTVSIECAFIEGWNSGANHIRSARILKAAQGTKP